MDLTTAKLIGIVAVMTTTKKAERVRVGDSIVFLGQVRRVARIRKYTGSIPEIFAVAECDSVSGCPRWGMSLCRGAQVEVAS